MADRYFIQQSIQNGRALLTGAEAHHLTHVMRGRVGQQVLLFDGRGREFLARIDRIARSEVELTVISVANVDRELPIQVTLAVAVPKGERQRWLVEKLTELGVTQLAPLATERAVVQLGNSGLDRLRRTVIEASKQCGRTRLMEILEPQPIADVLASTQGERLVAHPGGISLASAIAVLQERKPDRLTFVVGPEGGLTAAELESAQENDWTTVDLGNRILRIESAAVLLASAAAILTETARPTE